MYSEYHSYVDKFNELDNEFGQIDEKILKSDLEDHRVLYYYFPMIERASRLIFSAYSLFDLENVKSSTFRTFYSLVLANEKLILNLLGEDFGVEYMYYIKSVFGPEGIRNSVMHFNKKHKRKVKDAICGAKYILLELVKFYVIKFCG